MLALANQQKSAGFDPVAAFDAGEFTYGDDHAPGGGGELRRAQRLGGGPSAQVRVDPGGRGWKAQQHQAAAPPEDFGFDGGRELEAYLQEGADGGGDILAAFHRSGAAGAVMSESPQQQGSTDDFASSPLVQQFNAMQRTAGRVYTPDEQRELEAEYHPMGARNMPTPDDLAGTHYVMGM
jgi:hypothetical protein